ncbi:MAG: DNA repair protein RecO [Patescibacteria group bacterium]
MYSATGIVLSRQNKGEHDQIITAFTKEYGKVALVSKGIRKGSAKLSGHVALFNLTQLRFVLGRRQKVLTAAVEVQSFAGMKKAYQKINTAQRVAVLVERYTLFEERDEAIFHLVLGALDYLDRREFNALELKFFLRYFEFKFLALLGYEPEDKTIVEAFAGERTPLSERELDDLERRFSIYFENIYGKAGTNV